MKTSVGYHQYKAISTEPPHPILGKTFGYIALPSSTQPQLQQSIPKNRI